MWMLEGINYLRVKLQINILKNKKVIKLLEHWLKEKKIANTIVLFSQHLER